jgi:hypothetical protein
MSYVVSIRRTISKSDLLTAIEGDEQFSIISEGDNYIDLMWVDGEESVTFSLSQGEITVTTPSDKAWEKMNRLSQALGAAVIGEEDDLPIRPQVKRGVFTNRQTWIGWPVLVIVLSVLLIWKW